MSCVRPAVHCCIHSLRTWESTRTMKEGMLTICLPTRMWRWRMSTRAWWIDLARPSLKTRVWREHQGGGAGRRRQASEAGPARRRRSRFALPAAARAAAAASAARARPPPTPSAHLQAALQHVLGRQRQHVIQLVLGLVQEAVAVHAAQQGLALKHAPAKQARREPEKAVR